MKRPNSPSEQCKAAGLPSLAYLCKAAQIKKQTAINWHRDRPDLFRLVVLGAATDKKMPTELTQRGQRFWSTEGEQQEKPEQGQYNVSF